MSEKTKQNKTTKHTKYLTIHGHFYQPPRENPWIEEIELQESATPRHDWNDKICWQCYEPNSVSRIVDNQNRILNIVNNYELMSFNFGPTLLSWMEVHANSAYRRIIEADKNSVSLHQGHGCAIAQVYNHIILPLANLNDKYTQVIWGIKDFEKRFERKPEGIWLAETAVDAQTLEVLIDCGIKYTILSPHQAQCVKSLEKDDTWHDVSWGSIDPSMPYRYFPDEDDKERYIDLFFYDGAISKSVAFDNLLCDGNKFANRLQDGYVQNRNHPQLVNIATDGESYGHHTKFGDMALSYVLEVKAEELGFKITNYGWFLEKFPPKYQVDIKPQSSWSCCHGVGRWADDCGCSTGAQPGWNQKWRKPLRDALDYVRDELIKVCSCEGSKYYKDFWDARNKYIDVILDRSEESYEKFFKENTIKNLTQKEKTKAIKLMEMQRFCQLMYTSCGWFFAEISGIETTQIMKYALRAMEIAQEFTNIDIEKKFLSILNKAKSNIEGFGTGKDVFEKFVKPSVVTIERLTAQWAFSSKFLNPEDLDEIYCYKVKKINTKTVKKNQASINFGRIEFTSKITFEKFDMSYVIFNTSSGEYYCSVKKLTEQNEYAEDRQKITDVFMSNDLIETLKTIQERISTSYYTLKDILIDRRKVILEKILISKLIKTEKTYRELYDELKAPVSYYMDLGMDIPDVFRVSAKFTLLRKLENELEKMENFCDEKAVARIVLIKHNADKFYINLNKCAAGSIISKKLENLIKKLASDMQISTADNILGLLNILEKLNIQSNINEAQNIFFEEIYSKISILIEHLETSDDKNADRALALKILEIGQMLNINTEFFRPHIDKASLPKRK